VEVFKLGPNDDVFPFASENESEVALEEALENGFSDCVEIDTLKRRVRRSSSVGPRGLKRPMGLKLACPPLTSGDVPAALREPAAETSKPTLNLGADAVQAKHLTSTAVGDLTTLHDGYLGFIRDGTETAATWSPELEPWAQRLRGGLAGATEKANIAEDFAKGYGLAPQEREALGLWSRYYRIEQKLLKSAFEKIPAYSGVCVRKTRMSQETIDMLVNGWAGRRGKPGVYDVSDLVVNTQSINFENPDEELRFIMTTTPGITKYRGNKGVISRASHTFVIRSSRGKYITPATEGQEEIAFIDGDQARFKLLGWANGLDNRPTVFYFNNVI
ncbi:hypothetical protein LY78DRAFT_595024, partial [Colletotrichum sublineola]